MGKGTVKIKYIFLFLLAGFLLLTTASGYLYKKNKTYQYENRRLIIINDSILSENIELKNALQLKRSAAAIQGNFKMGETK
jgi:dTDP-4-dehydrorhamnose 3,5-epimerase-like enzyme